MRFCSEVVLRTMVFGSVSFVSLAVIGLRAENTTPSSLDATAAPPHVVSVVRVDARTGRLIRTVVVTPVSGTLVPGTNPQVRAMVEETAKNLDVSPLLVDSVI